MKLRVVLADDHPFVLLGVRAVLAEAGGIEVVGEASSPGALFQMLSALPCDVVVTDLTMPGGPDDAEDGLLLLRRLRRDWPSLHIVVLTSITNVAILRAVMNAGVTAMLTNELGPESGEPVHRSGDERFVCDTILTLRTSLERRSLRRTLEVVKSRGQNFIGGVHTMRITEGKGIEMYRRTQSRPTEFEVQPSSHERSSIGSPSVDELLGGGLYRGSVTLVAGISGTGKTVVGTQFLTDGRNQGRKGLIVSLDEHPLQLIRNAETLGFDLKGAVDEGDIDILYDSPLELELDTHFDRIVRTVERKQIDRVVLDSLAAYESASPSEASDFVYALVTFLKNRSITTLMNYESPELLGISQISEDLKVSHLVDNIILLNLVEISTQLRRAISIPKVRGSRNIARTREFVIEPGGIKLVVEDEALRKKIDRVPQLPFSAYTGLLSRSPPRTSPMLDERILNGDGLPASPKMAKEK